MAMNDRDVLGRDWDAMVRDMERSRRVEPRRMPWISAKQPYTKVEEAPDPDEMVLDLILGKGTGDWKKDLAFGLMGPAGGAATELSGGQSGVLDWMPGAGLAKAAWLVYPKVIAKVAGKSSRDAYRIVLKETAQQIVDDVSKNGKALTPENLKESTDRIMRDADYRVLNNMGLNGDFAKNELYDEASEIAGDVLLKAENDVTNGVAPNFRVSLDNYGDREFGIESIANWVDPNEGLNGAEELVRMTPGEITAMRKRQSALDSYRRKISEMTPEELAEYRANQAEYHKTLRANMSQEELDASRARQRQYNSARRASLTENELKEYRDHKNAVEKARRERFTPEQKAEYNAKHSKVVSAELKNKMASLTPAQKEIVMQEVNAAGKEAKAAAILEGITDKAKLNSIYVNARTKAKRRAYNRLMAEPNMTPFRPAPAMAEAATPVKGYVADVVEGAGKSMLDGIPDEEVEALLREYGETPTADRVFNREYLEELLREEGY